MGDAHCKENESSSIESIIFIQKEHEGHLLKEVDPQMCQQVHSSFIKEDVELLIFNRNTSTKLSKSDVLKKLKKANLTGQGFKKGVSYQTVKILGSTTYFKASTAIFA